MRQLGLVLGGAGFGLVGACLIGLAVGLIQGDYEVVRRAAASGLLGVVVFVLGFVVYDNSKVS